MERISEYGKKFLQRFGWKGVLNVVMVLCWFFFPFLLLYQLYLLTGQTFLLLDWAFLSIIFILTAIVLSCLFFVKLVLVRRKMMRHVENAKRMFDDPANPTSEENFRRECGKFIIPYLHFPSVFPLGFASMSKQGRLHIKILMRLVYLFVNFFISYLVILLLVNNGQSILNQASTVFSFISKWLPQLQDVFALLYQNIILLLVVSFFFSSYFSFKMVGELSPFPNYVFDVINDSFSVFSRLTILGMIIFSSPWIIKESMSTLPFSPFTFQAMTVKEIMQKSVENIEQTECKVTVWQYEVKDSSDVKNLKKMIFESTDIPDYIRAFCSEASDEEILKMINETKPILYLGTINNRCSIVGRVTYDQKARIYRATFTFDNNYVRNMFKSIAEAQTETQKKLSSKLPYSMTQLVQNLRVGENYEQNRD